MLGVFTPPGECVARGVGACQSRACVDAVSGGAACGRARFDTVYEDMVHPLDSVHVKLCEDACCVESCF
jgi:hypothetical protein